MKIKVVKERRESGSLVCKDPKQCVRKPEGHLKHQRMYGCGLNFLNSHGLRIESSVELLGTLLRVPKVWVIEQAWVVAAPHPWQG